MNLVKKKFNYVREAPTNKSKRFGKYILPVKKNGDDMVFVDCGTSTGNLYKSIKKLYKNYYGFEAAYSNYLAVLELTKENKCHNVFNKACYINDNEILTIKHIKSTDILSKGFSPNNNSIYFKEGMKFSSQWNRELTKDDIESHKVESISLSGIQKIVKKKIDILKVDIEMAEYVFLMNTDLKDIDFILIEIRCKKRYQDIELENYIKSQSFNLYKKMGSDYFFIKNNIDIEKYNLIDSSKLE